MAQKRDFLGEFRKIQSETDAIRNTLISPISKTALKNEFLDDIMNELRSIRKEINQNQENNEKKMDELQKENREIRMRIEEFEKKNETNQRKILEELTKNELRMNGISKELTLIRQEIRRNGPEVPIKESIIGEWKMIQYDNFDKYSWIYHRTFEHFSRNLKFELDNGKMKQMGGGEVDLIEGLFGQKYLYVEDNHLKTFVQEKSTIDRFIKEGKLHVVQKNNGDVWKRVYEKV